MARRKNKLQVSKRDQPRATARGICAICNRPYTYFLDQPVKHCAPCLSKNKAARLIDNVEYTNEREGYQ